MERSDAKYRDEILARGGGEQLRAGKHNRPNAEDMRDARSGQSPDRSGGAVHVTGVFRIRIVHFRLMRCPHITTISSRMRRRCERPFEHLP